MTTPTEQIQAQPAGKDVKQILAELSEKFPLCFSQSGEAKPLKIGIFQDLAERLSAEESISKTQIRHALRLYTSSWRYLAGVKLGVARVDLDGQPGDLIDEQQAAHAAETLEQSKAKAAEQRKVKAAAERAKQKEQQKAQPKAASSDKPAYKKTSPNKSAVAAKAARLQSKPQTTEKAVEQVVELVALNTATLKVGSAVQLKVGQKPVPATVLEVVKNDVVVQLASGMVIKTQVDKLFQA